MKGIVLRIEKSSIYDGDGLRTVVYLKGCPLSYKWCSTPESQNKKIEYGYGKIMTSDEVVQEVEKDAVFFYHSGGGVTLSGGEVLMQADFAKEILEKCIFLGINTAVETSLYAKYEEFEKISPFSNNLYVDIKMMDNLSHKKWVGTSNDLILENLARICEDNPNLNIHVRIPVIPSINDTKSNIQSTIEFCEKFSNIRDIELLPYHKFGVDTYKKLGRNYDLSHIESPKIEDLKKLALSVERMNLKPSLIVNGKNIE